MTNFEHIKAMSVDELAKILDTILESDICLASNADVICEECLFSKFCELSQGEAKNWLNREKTKIRTKTFTINFKHGPITVQAFNKEEARILAQAEVIKRGWDYTIIEEDNSNEIYDQA